MTAFVFPGQGAQYSAMGKEICEKSSAAAEVFDRCEKIMPGITKLCVSASDDILQRTENTQPAVFCTSLAFAAALEEKGIYADVVAGFSLGEVSALTFAGVFSLEEGLRLVIERGRLMSECVSRYGGGMVAVLRMDDKKVEDIAKKFTEIYPVNYNSDGQLAVAGSLSQLDDFCNIVSENGGRAVRLKVGGAFHCPYMDGAGEGLKEYLADIKISKPRIPVYSNYTSLAYGKVEDILPRQVCNPVLWKQSVCNMVLDGTEKFIETGPGNVLCGLIKRIAPQVSAVTAQKEVFPDESK